MSHLDFYQHQARIRGVHSLDDVVRLAGKKTYLYDQLVRRWLPEEVTLPVAELACGHGSFLHWLKLRNFTSVTGVDSSPEQVALARLVGVTVEENDVNRWLVSQPKNHFTAFVAIDFVEHLAKDEFMELLRGCHTALVPGGSLIFRLPNGESPFVGANYFNDITHVWTYTPNCLNSLAQMTGFSRTEFADESADAIRDHRWLKVPLAKISIWILRALVQAVTREKIRYFSPYLWARLVK